MNASRNIVWPIVMVVLGVLFLAHNLGYLGFSQLKAILATWWPVILIALGLAGLISRGK
jgi:predicted RND superfamily exporter protein